MKCQKGQGKGDNHLGSKSVLFSQVPVEVIR